MFFLICIITWGCYYEFDIFFWKSMKRFFLCFKWCMFANACMHQQEMVVLFYFIFSFFILFLLVSSLKIMIRKQVIRISFLKKLKKITKQNILSLQLKIWGNSISVSISNDAYTWSSLIWFVFVSPSIDRFSYFILDFSYFFLSNREF